MNRFLSLITFLLLGILSACSQPANGPAVAELLRPAANDTLSFPIYDDFSALESLFAQENDTTYVINFWATWCKPCVEELPHFVELAERHQGEPLQIVLVSLDFKKDIRTKLPAFLKARNLNLPVVALTDSKQAEWIDRVDSKWGGAIPVTVIYKNGLRFFINEQFDTYQDLETVVTRLL